MKSSRARGSYLIEAAIIIGMGLTVFVAAGGHKVALLPFIWFGDAGAPTEKITSETGGLAGAFRDNLNDCEAFFEERDRFLDESPTRARDFFEKRCLKPPAFQDVPSTR